jgi:Ni/Fe-hydrogenase subunit HybB-like protein
MESLKKKDTTLIDIELLANVNWSKGSKIWLGTLFGLLFVCLYFYYLQLKNGLGVTGMRDYVSWGIYISNFVFFVASSLIGMLISSVLGLLGINWIRPISRIAEIIAVAFAMVAGLVIITDMGRPDRLHHVFLFGRIQSPIIWDITVVITYVTLSTLLLYLPLIPDMNVCKDKCCDIPKFQRKIYKILSLGWTHTPEQYQLNKRFTRILLILIIPVALAIHTVTSWLFAMTLRAGWDSPIFGPYFVSGAFVAGCASVIIAMYFYRNNFRLKDYITDMHFDKMGKLLVLVALVYVYFNINEILVPAYKLKGPEAEHLKSLLMGHDSIMFWMVQIGGLILPFLLLMLKPMRKPLPAMLISVFILAGAWFKRYLIVVPIQLHPYLPIQNVPKEFMHYTPTVAEIAITAAMFLLVLIIITFLSKLFPVVPIWEIKEELEHEKK